MSKAAKAMPSAAARAAAVPPRSTRARISTGSAPKARTTLGRFHRGRAAGGGVLGDHDTVAGLQRPRDAALHAMVLGLLADAEGAQRPAASGGDGGDAEGQRVRAHGQAADGRGVGGDDLERRLGHEQDAFGPAGRLLGVEEPRALLAGLQGERPRFTEWASTWSRRASRSIAAERTVHRMDLRIFTEPQQGASYDDLLAVAKATEELGFDAFFRSDHFLKMGSVSGLPGPTDAWTTLAGLARDTSRIRLGTLVTLGDVPVARARWPSPWPRSTR